MVRLITEAHEKKVSTVNKVFGDLVYDKGLSKYKIGYIIYDFKEFIFY